MKFLVLIFLGFFSIGFLNAQEQHVLVFHKTDGFYHESIPKGISTIKELGIQHNFKITSSDNSKEFSPEILQKYDLVIFLNTTGNILNSNQKSAFEDYIKSGGSFFGIHAAADTEYDWKWYGNLVGAYFDSHPEISKASLEIVKPNHPTVAHLPIIWERIDEWYNYKEINPKIDVLINLDESSYSGGNQGKSHPIAWYQELEGGGISIYTGGGHTKEAYDEVNFRTHLAQCILFALQ